MDVTLLCAATDEFLAGLAADTAVAIGLTWAPMTAGLQASNALAMAAAAKATHLVHAQGRSSVGFAKLKRSEQKQLTRQRVSRVLAAASLLASIKPVGTSMVVLPVGDMPPASMPKRERHDGRSDDLGGSSDGIGTVDLVWVAAVSNGAVLRGYDAIVSRMEADVIWAQLQQRYQDKASRFAPGSGFEWQDLVDLASEHQPDSKATQAMLAPVKSSALGVVRRIPRPLKYAGALIGIASLAQYLVIPLVGEQLARYRKAQEPVVDPTALWQGAYDGWAAHRRLSGAQALGQALAALRAVPVRIGQWNLMSSGCELDGAKAVWRCSASYAWPEGSVGSSASTNAIFEAHVPKDWTLDWKPMNAVTGRFQLAADTRRFDAGSLQAREWHLVHSVSYLQRFERVLDLGAKPLGEFAKVPVVAPRLANGAVAPVPPNLKLPVVATLQVDGPLRSMAQKMADMPEVSWKKLSVAVTKNATPDRARSQLMANLQGEIYAKP